MGNCKKFFVFVDKTFLGGGGGAGSGRVMTFLENIAFP